MELWEPTQPTSPDHYVEGMASHSSQLALGRILLKLGSLQLPYLMQALETMARVGASLESAGWALLDDQLGLLSQNTAAGGA